MSPKGASKSAAATLSHPAGRPIAPRPGAPAPLQDEAATEGAMATRPQPPRRPLAPARPTAPARVSPTSRHGHHSYNDPCNYLG